MCQTKPCLECAKPLEGRDYRADFCGVRCRKTWNNRRMKRGAELYDLFMIVRFRRKESSELGIWSLLCRLASVWQAEDKEAGRTSFGKPAEVKTRMVRYVATRLVHTR